MKGNADIIEMLNEALSEELTAINQYFLHAEMCENWGYKRQSAASKKQAIDEMKHAEDLIERILFLEGKPNMSKYQMLTIGQTVPEMIENDLKLEHNAVILYNRIIEAAIKKNDQGTAELLKKILKDEESHVDSLEEMQDKIRDMGVQIYYLSIQD
ncbi:MAG: bacterioferritin [Acidobacteriota bacterium]|nr:bacterioferritin [Acidobacteriota bacterium]